MHPKAMPVLLTTSDEWRTWLEAQTEEALALQRPLADAMMREATRGERRDGASPAGSPIASSHVSSGSRSRPRRTISSRFTALTPTTLRGSRRVWSGWPGEAARIGSGPAWQSRLLRETEARST